MTNAEAWDYAIGMIRVDGLEPTEDLKKYIEKEKTGEATMEDVKKFLDKKYKMKGLWISACVSINPFMMMLAMI